MSARRRIPALLLITAAIAGGLLLAGSSSATSQRTSSGSTARPRTLVASPHRIWAFVLDARRVTWVARGNAHGPPRCAMHVLTLRTGRTSLTPLSTGKCRYRFRLGSGTAAWVKNYGCGNNECFWDVVGVSAGARRSRIVEDVDISCAYTCAGYSPRPAITSGGGILVYAAGNGGAPARNSTRVKRIVGGHGSRLFDTGGDIQWLLAGGGAIGAVSRVLDGDGCGCLDSPVWSPDGSKIAYLDGTFFNQPIDPYGPTAALAVMNADGSGRRDLTGPGVLLGDSLSWSPDGRQIAYVNATGKVTVVSVDGSGSHELAAGYSPAWSPSGSRIAFATGNGNPAVFTVNPDGSGIQQLASFPGHNVSSSGMAWSPDGASIAFSLDGFLELLDANGGNAHQVGTNTTGDEPSFSPNSRQIVFRGGNGLWMIGADGTGLRRLTEGPDEHPSWSPDGQRIVFGSQRDDPYVDAGEVYDKAFLELYLVDADGSHLHPLSFTRPSVWNNQTTFYSARGRRLADLPGLPALVGHIAAVGSVIGRVGQVTFFNAFTGRRLSRIAVGKARSTFEIVGGDAHWFVFYRGRTISALNIRTHRIIRLARAATDPVGLSVSGHQVAWAENVFRGRGFSGRIQALQLPS